MTLGQKNVQIVENVASTDDCNADFVRDAELSAAKDSTASAQATGMTPPPLLITVTPFSTAGTGISRS
jgi:hypothetical protein